MSSCGLVGSLHASLAPARWLLRALNTGARTASRGVRRSASSWWPAASFAPDHAHPGGERAYGLAVGLPARSLFHDVKHPGDQPHHVRRLGPALVFSDWGTTRSRPPREGAPQARHRRSASGAWAVTFP